MKDPTCSSCVYFRQHYSLDSKKLFQVYCGHCTYPRVRSKKPDSKACQQYVKKPTDESPFVSKEFLSRAILEYVLKLELLPQIQEVNNTTEQNKKSSRRG